MISVLMSVYNGERWLGEAIQSVLDQTYPDFEFLIVNDGSTDGSLQIIEEYARRDSRIRVISHENWGLVRTLNEALPLARGYWVARFDADDLMAPDRLERQLAFIEANPDIAVASCFAHYINTEGEVVGHYTNPLTSRKTVKRWLEEGRVIHFIQSGAIYRKDVVLEVGGYRAGYSVTEDTDLWNRIAERGYTVLVQPEVLMRIRIHDSSATRSAALTQAKEFRWLEESARRRRAGLPERTLAEFEAAERALPLFQRANLKRRDMGHVLYKSATVARTRGEKGRMALNLAGSLLLYPSYCISNVWNKTIGARLSQLLEQTG